MVTSVERKTGVRKGREGGEGGREGGREGRVRNASSHMQVKNR